ncbi:MAG: DUF3048 domain-containing protein [Chloroflexi bacterium]|nr:DUF3048 domain-containing protein [Chloroflexota bacterium]MCI0579109.1 DUF3048 domain-containing protein [Chloroflexota bacterium]MCI0643326.1 DUF3048 domain-containing protein [Chloroflexota bacterium]MCI0728305.1 DUF3048 domain-containing protein [Chloroflexota bacterium]
MFKKFASFCFVFLLLGAACRQEPPTATLALPTAMATAEAITQTTPVATSTLAPTSTLAAPGPTLTPIPTTTPPATPTATGTPEAVVLLTAADFGDDRNPLTGELVADPTLLQRRPIAVKISNSPAQYVRPQAGLSQADLVFEHATEGAITRFTAVIYSQTPPDMGPIRSARLIDVEIPAMYDAALAFSGSSIGVSQRLFGSDFRSRILRSNEPGYYRTGEDKPYEHTLHGNPELWWEALDDKGENRPPAFTSTMAFASETPAGGEPASEVNIRYRDFTSVDWRYDPDTGRYWRWVDGEPHVDANNDQQISAANVVVVFALHQLNMSICEYQVGNTCQAFSAEIQIWEEGDALIFRDGLALEATWKRENRSDMLTFWNDEGNPVPLQIGNTWFQVVPYHYTNPVAITP